MKRMTIVHQLVVGALVLGFAFPKAVIYAASNETQPSVRDVALHKEGLLVGQVIDSAGVPQSKVPVTLLRDNRPIAVATTNEQGYFAFRGLKGGVYHLSAANGVASYRVWQSDLAPPGAAQGAVVVANEDLTRGQMGCLGMIMSRPLVIAGVIGAAIAIPLAVALSEDEEGPASP